MTALSWNEIRQRAIQFSRDWENATDERAEAQTFWNEFFNVFGIKRRTVAAFEEPVKSLKNTYHRIDLFWKGRLLVEHKSAGESLGKAQSQAFNYIQELATSGRNDEIPRYVVVSDFQRFALYDLEPDDAAQYELTDFDLASFHAHLRHFAFIIGQKTHRFGEEDPANLEAAQIMADLHDAIAEGGYSPHDLERLLVRILFCLFSEDTGIFEPAQFELYLRNRTRPDGSDMGSQLYGLFDVLNTPVERRPKYCEEDLAAFPFVNGELFAERLSLAAFNRDMRNRLLSACNFDWSRISPAIFGSLFQGIMEPQARRQIGAHYTSERDILKVIRPLFLDELETEFEQISKDRSTRRKSRLEEFQQKLASLKLLDPACGCGNFLVISYRELRRLELDTLKLLHPRGEGETELPYGEVAKLSRVDVDQFYGIEIGEWPVRIAETALWLTDHQMNIELSLAFGNVFQRIPLKTAPHIRCANALRMDWNELLPAEECSYVLGNPPFVGSKFLNPEQKSDVCRIAGFVKGYGVLDYVTLWYFRAVEYVQKRQIRCAFVSTNSISQGEQVGVLWTELFSQGVKIHFAHRTFSWQSEAKGKAHVHVVIIGFGLHENANKRIFEYDNIKAEPSETFVSNVNPYLVEGSDVTVQNRSRPLCDVPEIGIGNKPIDGGRYLFDDEGKREFLLKEPAAEKYFRPWIGSVEFIHGYHRWCLWLGDATASDLRQLPECMNRVNEVRKLRLASKSIPTRKLAETPRRFHVENFPSGRFLVIPKVSSERRPYIPSGFLSNGMIVSDLCFILPHATSYHFGVLTSAMHMAWVRQVCGRLESRYRYSAKLVYNNYPWPLDATEAQQAKVEACAETVLTVRQNYLDAGQCLADLYDPLLMPRDLLKAHQALDRAVDRCYRPAKFNSERERVEYLFALYEQLTAPLAPSEKAKKRRPRRKPAK